MIKGYYFRAASVLFSNFRLAQVREVLQHKGCDAILFIGGVQGSFNFHFLLQLVSYMLVVSIHSCVQNFDEGDPEGWGP